jgi:hypothetical protein
LNEVLHGSGNAFEGYIRINAMLIEQVDDIRPEAQQRGICDRSDSFRRAVQTLTGNSVLEAELRCDHDLVADRT